MFRGLDVGPNEVVLAALVWTNRRREPRLNVRPLNVGTDPHVAFFVNEANRGGFHRFQPFQKGHVVIAKHEVNVRALAGNHPLPRRARGGLNVERRVLVVQHGKVGSPLQPVGGRQVHLVVRKGGVGQLHIIRHVVCLGASVAAFRENKHVRLTYKVQKNKIHINTSGKGKNKNKNKINGTKAQNYKSPKRK